jgi:hypothetical protein
MHHVFNEKERPGLSRLAGVQTKMISYLSMGINLQVRCKKEALWV